MFESKHTITDAVQAHQNKFHAETIRVLTLRFASLANVDVLEGDERDLWEYFSTLYKNSSRSSSQEKSQKVHAGCF